MWAQLVFNCQAPDAGNGEILHMFGTDEQKERFLRPLVEGTARSFFSMTEPEVSGADPTELRTTAVLDGDEWVIDGHKWFSSSAEGAAFGIVMAVTDPDAPPHRRMSQILVPADTPGFELVRPIPVMGHAGRGWSTHCEVRYTDVRVPRENVLGEPGDGFRIAQKRLGPGRIHHVMRWLGQMQRAFELMCSYALEREVGGGPLAEKQTVQNWIADSAAEIQACRLLTLDAARKLDEGDEARVEVSLIKFFAARVLNDVIDRAIQVHGARGLTDETPARPHVRAGPRRPDLRRPGRGAPHGRQPPDPEGVPGRRRLHASTSRARRSIAARQLRRLEAVRAFLALEGDAAVAADQVEPVGPAAVGERDRVVDVVEQHRDPRLAAAAAHASAAAARSSSEVGSASAISSRRLSASTQPSSGCASRM